MKKIKDKNTSNRTKIIELDSSQLPLLIRFKTANIDKEYVLKTNKCGSSIFLNKRETL